MGRGYCPEQLSYLEEKIGQMSIKSIARQLGKKPKSLDTYRKRKNIPSGRMAADGISVAIFSEAAGRCPDSVYDWIEQKGLPVKLIPVGPKGFKEIFIDLNKFWEWAWEHKHFIDFSKIEKGALGKEPDWVHEQRTCDISNWGKKGWERSWSASEDTRLKQLLRLQKYTYRQLADIMQRTELSIQNRLYKINEKLRPIPEARKAWSCQEVELLTKLLREGYSIFQISRAIGRSELQVKTKISRIEGSDIR